MNKIPHSHTNPWSKFSAVFDFENSKGFDACDVFAGRWP